MINDKTMYKSALVGLWAYVLAQSVINLHSFVSESSFLIYLFSDAAEGFVSHQGPVLLAHGLMSKLGATILLLSSLYWVPRILNHISKEVS